MKYTIYNKSYTTPFDLIKKLKSHFVNDTLDEFREMPPFWIISEFSTFGNILTILESMNKKAFDLPQNNNLLDKLSQEFGAKNLKELNSWLRLIRDVRNRVAHHSRVLNCNYREPSGIRQKISNSFNSTQANKIYLFLLF